jgi:hypothetical protein
VLIIGGLGGEKLRMMDLEVETSEAGLGSPSDLGQVI